MPGDGALGGNSEELGGLTRTHPAPRQQAPPVTPPGGPRADWLKDQPTLGSARRSRPPLLVVYPRTRASTARVSSGLRASSVRPGLQPQPSRPRPSPRASRSLSLAGPILAWEAPRSGASVCPVRFLKGWCQGTALEQRPMELDSFKCNTYSPLSARLCVNPSPGFFHSISPPPPPRPTPGRLGLRRSPFHRRGNCEAGIAHQFPTSCGL